MIEEEKIVKDPFDEPLEPPESVERLYQKKKPTGTIIPMSLSSCFPHAAYHLHATSHPHFTIFVFSTHKNSKNIKTGWKDNKVK